MTPPDMRTTAIARPLYYVSPMEEIIPFLQKAFHSVVANHMEAFNHCPAIRSILAQELDKSGLLSQAFISADGETPSMYMVIKYW
jgi:hypothetical protein